MIKKLTINNFQSHEKAVIDFDKGINSFIGSSDQGKTAVLRALYWCLFNRPGGLSFLSYWALGEKNNQILPVSVIIETEKGIVERKKTKKFNGYIINNSEKFEALNRDVPEDIKKVVNINEVNIQKQLDAHFLVSASAGEVARFFNNVINLNIIDEMLSSVDSKKRKNKADNIKVKNDIEKTEKGLKELEWIDIAAEVIRRADKIELKKKGKEDKLKIIKELHDQYIGYSVIIERLKNIIEAEKLSISIDKIIKEIEQNKKVKIELENYNDSYNEYQNQVNLFDVIKTEKLSIEIDKIIKEVKEKINIITELKKYHHSYIDYQNQVNIFDINKTEKLSISIDKIIKELEEKRELRETFIMLNKSYFDYKVSFTISDKRIKKIEKELPESCPLCGNKLDGGKK